MSSYQVFARKYRPRTFDDVLGQDHVVRTLRNAIERNRLHHAYLFVGPRGTGKTSTARILAKALNCPDGPRADFDPDDPVCIEIAEGRSLDVLEIDGASNNGVEQVRELRENVKFAPTRGKFRIYYIDEVHMLSGAAFNALLKTLEEPPPHAKFIFATTEAHKVLPTIISRCQRFDLRRIPDSVIADHLLHIAGNEGVGLDPLAAHAIARGAEGGMRDAQSMLDQLVAFCGNRITEQEVLDIFGFTAHETISRLAEAVLEQDTGAALEVLHAQNDAGKDLTKLLADFIGYLRTLLIHQVAPEGDDDTVAPTVAESIARQAGLADPGRLVELIDQFAAADAAMKWSPNKRLHFEVALIKAIRKLGETSISEVIEALAGGSLPEPRRPAARPPRTRAAAPTVGDASASKTAPPPAEAERPAKADATLTLGARGPSSGAGAPERAPAPTPAAPPPDESERRDPAAPPVRSSDPEDGARVWADALAEIAKSKPILAPWASSAVFSSIKGRHFTIAFHPEDSHRRDHLERPKTRETIGAILETLTGVSYDLKFEIRADVERVPDEPVEVADEVDEGSDAVSGSAAAESSEAVASAPAEAEGGGFYDDPLIREALELFDAHVKEHSSP